MEPHDLITKVIDWHYKRDLIDGSTDKDQVLKLMQEMGELSNTLMGNKSPKDDIGDMMVVLLNIIERNKLYLVNLLNEPLRTKKNLEDVIDHLIDINKSMGVYNNFSTNDQFLDIVNHVGLLSEAVCKNKYLDDILAGLVECLINIAYLNSLTLMECLEYSYNEIANRKGKKINGVFVKEGDLNANT